MSDIALTGHCAMARLLEQPDSIREVIAAMYRSPTLSDVRLHWIYPRHNNDSIDGPLEAMSFTCVAAGNATAISLTWTHVGLKAAAQRRNDFGLDWSDELKQKSIPDGVRDFVQALASMGFRLCKVYRDFGTFLKFYCGHASETDGSPYGIRVEISQGSYLSGSPSPNHKPVVRIDE